MPAKHNNAQAAGHAQVREGCEGHTDDAMDLCSDGGHRALAACVVVMAAAPIAAWRKSLDGRLRDSEHRELRRWDFVTVTASG